MLTSDSRLLVLLLVVGASSCSAPPVETDGGNVATTDDAGSEDAGLDFPIDDAGTLFETPEVDAGVVVALPDDAGLDFPTEDAGVDDAGVIDAGVIALPDATSCPVDRPRYIGGVFQGEDGRALNALIGITYDDSMGHHLDSTGTKPQGTPGTTMCGGYSACFRMNPTLPAAGAAMGNRAWGKCVGPDVTRVWIEMYPKNAQHVTDFARYGEAVDNRPVSYVANVADIFLRLPVRVDLGGNTGFVHGNVLCHGAPVTPTVLRAWSNQSGAACGVQGFAASGTSGSGRYLINWLAAGQCNAPEQLYQVRVTYPCDGVSQTQQLFTPVARAWKDTAGAWHGATLNFGVP